jgi:hypothetical protein
MLGTRRGNTRGLAAGLLLGLMLAASFPVVAAAADSASFGSPTYRASLPGDPRECAAAVRSGRARSTDPCLVTVVSSLPLDGWGRVRLTQTAQAATTYWRYRNEWMEVYSLSWKVRMDYQVRFNWAYVQLIWRHCGVPYAVGVGVDVTWCSAFPDWVEPDYIDVGANWKVSLISNGFPVSATYWMRQRQEADGGWGAMRSGRG